MSLPSDERQFSSVELSAIIVVAVCVVCVLCGWCYRHVAPLWWETVQFPGVVGHHRGSGLCGVCPICVVGVTDMSRPSERQFSSLELSAIIVVAVCVVCVLYMWLVLQTCRSPLRDSSVPWTGSYKYVHILVSLRNTSFKILVARIPNPVAQKKNGHTLHTFFPSTTKLLDEARKQVRSFYITCTEYTNQKIIIVPS